MDFLGPLRPGVAAIFVLGVAASCSPPSPAPAATSVAPAEVVTVAEAFETPRRPGDDVDSVAFWKGEAGDWLLATAKKADVLNVYNASTGELLRQVGGPGEEPGKLRRPNGIAVVGDHVVVVERDNHRVQVFTLPGFEPAAVFGAEVLRRPYGLAVTLDEGDIYDVFVTDNYETPLGEIPPPAELGERVKRFRVRLGAEVEAEYVASFGATEGAAVLYKVESIAADPATGELLIAEEIETDRSLKVYTSQGRPTAYRIGEDVFTDEAEGIAIFACDDGSGYYLVTDQHKDRSYFHVFARPMGQHLGVFAGELTANTDGVWLTRTPTARFPAGAFFAVHDDQSVTAFDWRDVAAEVGLAAGCPVG